ncbi:MAG: RloB domain-containing protein, partial [Candidatus Thermoplasmatota archaeon]|nr:RloB domain-containing protein [Candidatus Thermoplasmatota archaeon]
MRTPKTFGKRSTADDKELKLKARYFLTFEGEETEVQYFSGVIQFKKELGINDLLEIIPLIRNYEEKSWSHPCKFIRPL